MARKKKLKPKERGAIASLLRAVASEGAHDDLDSLIDASIDEVQFWVPHIRDQNLLYDQIDVPEDFKKQYRQISKHVDKILWFINHDYYQQQIEDYPSELRTGLENLKSMMQIDLPAGRGRKKSTPKKRLHELVQVLATLYHQVSQTMPTLRAKEAYDPADEAENPGVSTLFEEFVHACTDPYRVKLTQHDIEQGRKLFQETQSK